MANIQTVAEYNKVKKNLVPVKGYEGIYAVHKDTLDIWSIPRPNVRVRNGKAYVSTLKPRKLTPSQAAKGTNGCFRVGLIKHGILTHVVVEDVWVMAGLKKTNGITLNTVMKTHTLHTIE